MIAFEVSVNGKLLCTAGIDDFGVVTAILTRVRRRAEASRDGKRIEEELTFEVSGFDSADPKAAAHLKWLSEALGVGDSISIRVVDTESVSTPTDRRADDPQAVARSKRQYYERLKREYGE